MVNYMINSGVAKYLEFRSIENIFIPNNNNNENNVKMVENSNKVIAVPCSKGDVFKSKLLNTLEKRSLMKLLQFTADWGREREGLQINKLNENYLATGSALQRPQNKDNTSTQEIIL